MQSAQYCRESFTGISRKHDSGLRRLWENVRLTNTSRMGLSRSAKNLIASANATQLVKMACTLVDLCLECVVDQGLVGRLPDSLKYKATGKPLARRAADNNWKKEWIEMLPDGLPVDHGDDFDVKTGHGTIPDENIAALNKIAVVSQALSFRELFPDITAPGDMALAVYRQRALQACIEHYMECSACIIRYTGKLRYPCVERALSVINSTFGSDVDPWECLKMVTMLWTPAECMILGI